MVPGSEKNRDFSSNQTMTFFTNVEFNFLDVLICSEIQLKSPNWLFGSRKPEESGSATRPGADDSEKGVTSSERESTISATWNDHEEGIFQRYY